MNLKYLISNLEYMADSPPREYGGFHPQVVKTAKAALRYIKKSQHCPLCGKPSPDNEVHDSCAEQIVTTLAIRPNAVVKK